MRGSLVAAPARPRARIAQLAQLALACTFFAALIAVFARIAIPLQPFTPVPFTLQPMAVMLTGMFLGRRAGFAALIEYLAAGALGAPVFAGGGGGIAYLTSISSAGYLAAYPVAAYVTGWLAERSHLEFRRLLLAGIAGLLVIYAGGDAYLAAWLHGDWSKALVAGTLPFIVFDVVKAGLAAAVASTTAGSWFAWARR
ncbi:MAG: biotin transporter BioY [Chloroflexota bacterium]